MISKKHPYIAIFGGIPDRRGEAIDHHLTAYPFVRKPERVSTEPPDSEIQEAKTFDEFCHELGWKVAQHGWTLVVGSGGLRTADRLVVEGARAYGKEMRIWPEVVLVRPRGVSRSREDLLRNGEHLHVTIEEVDDNGRWVLSFLRRARLADLSIVIGGGRMADEASGLCVEIECPLIPVELYGGAAAYWYRRRRAAFQYCLPGTLWDGDIQAALTDGNIDRLIEVILRILKVRGLTSSDDDDRMRS